MQLISLLAEVQPPGVAEDVVAQTGYEFVLAILGALGVGGVVGTWIGQSQDRRTARAALVKAIHRMEAQRHMWLKHESVRTAISDLRTQGLVANAPKLLVDEYLTLALVAAWKFNQELEVQGSDEFVSIDSALQKATLTAAELLIFAAWHPWLARWRLRGMRRRLGSAKSHLTPELADLVHRTAAGRGQYTGF